MHGLGIIEQLADALEIQRNENGTSVHIEVGYAAPRGAALARAVR
jgi:hypothetical protein